MILQYIVAVLSLILSLLHERNKYNFYSFTLRARGSEHQCTIAIIGELMIVCWVVKGRILG